MYPEVSMKMLTAAIKKAIEVGMLKTHGTEEEIARTWLHMKIVLEAAMEARRD